MPTLVLTERFVQYLTYSNVAPLRESYDLEAIVTESAAIHRSIKRAYRLANVAPHRCCRCEVEQRPSSRWATEDDGLVFCSEDCRKRFALAEIRCSVLDAAIKSATRRFARLSRQAAATS